MAFDPVKFLGEYADAYNARDPEAMRAFLATDDPRFAMFEDFSADLLNGQTYEAMLESVADSTGEMSFELVRCDAFGDFAVVHGYQRLQARPGDEEEEGYGTLDLRATMWISLAGDSPKIVGGHFSAIPPDDDGCGCGCEDENEGGCCGGHHEGV
jgi:ketosteroid isomerase-like protein